MANQNISINMIYSETKCEEEGCNTRASFGTEDGVALFCSSHKREGMRACFRAEVRRPLFCSEYIETKCEEEGYNTRGSFGTEDGVALYCNTHKREGMKNVVCKMCEEEGCNIRASFGTEKGKPKYCNTHKREGMRACSEHKREDM